MAKKPTIKVKGTMRVKQTVKVGNKRRTTTKTFHVQKLETGPGSYARGLPMPIRFSRDSLARKVFLTIR